MFYMQRYIWPMVNALFITTALIYGMFLLVKSPSLELSERKVYRDLDWVHVPKDEKVILKKVVIEKPPVVESAPVIPIFTPSTDPIENEGIHVALFDVKPPELGPILPQSNQLTLVFSYPPVYPPSKIAREIEGYAQVGFSVSSTGAVYDAHIIDSKPKGAFEKSALKAIAKFKYKPRQVEGKPVNTQGQSYVFKFTLEK